jgi:dihydrofolate reductase
MGRLVYSSIASLDGYIADEAGNFDWAAPDAEVHAFVNDSERDVATYLYGRRTYEVMAAWQTITGEGEPREVGDYGEIWRAADKIVFSTTLTEPSTPRTVVRDHFDPEEVRRLCAQSPGDVSVGGAGLAATAIRAGLVAELRLLLVPVAVGGGTPALPTGVRWDLELREQRRFTNGTVLLRYAGGRAGVGGA